MKKSIFQEADFYGASRLVFGTGPLPLCYRASWMHGLGPVIFRNDIDCNVLLHFIEKNLPLHLVNNRDVRNLLCDQGFNAIDVGMPILYTSPFESDDFIRIYQRIFLPAHVVVKKDREQEYQQWINLVRKYGCDAICLPAADFKNCKDNNITFANAQILEGAHASDVNSLERIARYFRTSHEMITNSSGSHIVYATALGANVPIIPELGARAKELRRNSLSQQPVLSSVPRASKATFKDHMRKSVVEDVVKLWGSKDDNAKRQYSDYLIGTESKKSKQNIRALLSPESKTEAMHIFAYLVIAKLKYRIFKL